MIGGQLDTTFTLLFVGTSPKATKLAGEYPQSTFVER